VTTSAYRRAANQPPPLERYNLLAEDRPLLEALRREGGATWEKQVLAFGGSLGGEALEWGRLANAHPPVLRTHDRFGNRIDEVEFHPAWHSLMQIGVGAGLHALPSRVPEPGVHAARAAMFIGLGEVEAGVGCPLSMTNASLATLELAPKLAAEWRPRVTSLVYDPASRPPTEKQGVLVGMALTEKQGGSDVRANVTFARPVGDDEFELEGHKWFCSAPMCDAFLVLAQAPAGLSCFLVPRLRSDGERNGIQLQRLKDKLGNRSNASAEIELHGAVGRLVGDEGRGVRTIAEMINLTRLDCALGSTSLMRRAAAEATHHAAYRSAFGRLLVEQPLMQNVLADLCIEVEAATVTVMRVARAWDEADDGLRRIANAVAKYWICKATPPLVTEALECIGGNGYVEESVLPRLLRESPLNSLWEGAGNVSALDLLRAAGKEPHGVDVLLAEIEQAAGADPRLDAATDRLRREFADAEQLEYRARRIVELAALCLQGSLLVRHSPPEVADAFCVTRLGGDGGRAYGTLPDGIDCAAIVERHRPRLDS
jgi:putative acyl-CoA dehydrogenase